MRCQEDSIEIDGLRVARGIADWLCQLQHPYTDYNPAAASMLFSTEYVGLDYPASNWNYAFSIMGLLGAYKAFEEPFYEQAALRLGGYLKTLQIFDPFHEEHYGAIREFSPQTPWCYTRDALSAAWGFLELYRHNGEEEYLQRARIWAKWFFRKGLDEEGYPFFGVQFDPDFPHRKPHIRNDMQGSFQGGCLNFLYQLAKETGEKEWIGNRFLGIADHFVRYIQQPSGFFLSVSRDTKKPPEQDEYHALHRANDDLGTLGLLCAYRVTGNKAYLVAIKKFLNAVFASQLHDGNFEKSIAPIPVVLNVLSEADGLVEVSSMRPESVKLALKVLYSRQCDGAVNPKMRGGLIESIDNPEYVTVRSSCYALIYLLKHFAGIKDYLTGK
jgi:hypothetical protein